MNTAPVGYVKQIPTCPEKSITVTNCTRILESCSDRWTDLITFKNFKSRTFSIVVATSRSEYFTVKCIKKKLICCLSWSSREDRSADLARNSQTWPPKLSTLMNTITPEDIIIISETIPNSEQNLVYCAIWRTLISIEPITRPHKQICDREQTSAAYIS